KSAVESTVCCWPSCSRFFFSSRRRHTRWPRDWSSDVCSSDLASALGLGFALTDGNAAMVGSICRRLDGIPLAIELAVPRLKVLSVEQLDRGLSERFRLLTAGSRTALPRQQTLHALIDWSYGLLSDAEKILLARLSVFFGTAALASITAVVASAEIPAEQVSDLLLSLVEKSLVHADAASSEFRYGLL